MKENTKMGRVVGYLEKIFRYINEDFFDNEIAEPVITVQDTRGAYGHVTTWKAWKAGNELKIELNIGAATLNRPIEDTVGTIYHEMVHLWNMQKGIRDTSNNGVYHNRKFKDKAEECGMVKIEKKDTIGFSKTTPTDKCVEWCIERGLSEIKMVRGAFDWAELAGLLGKSGGEGGETVSVEPPKRVSSTRKYACPCCGQSVRATKLVNILCGDCQCRMELV